MEKLIQKAFEKAYMAKLKEAAPATEVPAGLITDQLIKEIVPVAFPRLTREVVSVHDVEKGSTSVVIPVSAKFDAVEEEVDGIFDTENSVLVTSKTITLDNEKGINVTFSRTYLEDAAWDAYQDNLKNASEALEIGLFDEILDEFDATVGSNTFSIGSTMTFADVVTGWELLESADYKVDYMLINPAEMADLLLDEKMTSQLYLGSEAVKSGVFPTVLGFSILVSTEVEAGTVYFVNKQAVHIAIRRDKKIEEFAYPTANKYGFLITCRYGIGDVIPAAIALGQKAS